MTHKAPVPALARAAPATTASGSGRRIRRQRASKDTKQRVVGPQHRACARYPQPGARTGCPAWVARTPDLPTAPDIAHSTPPVNRTPPNASKPHSDPQTRQRFLLRFRDATPYPLIPFPSYSDDPNEVHSHRVPRISGFFIKFCTIVFWENFPKNAQPQNNRGRASCVSRKIDTVASAFACRSRYASWNTRRAPRRFVRGRG